MHKNLPKRKNIRLQGYDYSQNGAYFITICTHDRLDLFGDIVVSCNNKNLTQRDKYDIVNKKQKERYIKMSLSAIYQTEEDRKAVEKFAKTGTHNAHLIIRANILLVLDRTGKKDHMRIKRTAESYGVSRQTVYNIIEDYHNSKDINDFLSRKQRETPPVTAKVDGEVEAHIVALACQEPPKGYAKWTLRLLASKAVELDFVESVSAMTVQRLLKKRSISLT